MSLILVRKIQRITDFDDTNGLTSHIVVELKLVNCKKLEEKAKAKREKMGIYESQIRNAANTNTRSISSKANANSNNSGYDSVTMGNVKPGSMASKANKVREFNEKNSKNS